MAGSDFLQVAGQDNPPPGCAGGVEDSLGDGALPLFVAFGVADLDPVLVAGQREVLVVFERVAGVEEDVCGADSQGGYRVRVSAGRESAAARGLDSLLYLAGGLPADDEHIVIRAHHHLAAGPG